MGNSIQHRDLLLATSGQSRETDRRTIQELGIPGETLMEIAGFGAAAAIASRYSNVTPLLFVCGKGNNAGDAFVCARELLSRGFDITLFPVFGTGSLSEDADLNLNRLLQVAKEMKTEITLWERWQDPSPSGLIIDGIFGTGFRSTAENPVSDVIDQINRSGRPVCALDIPSGLDSDTGEVSGTAVHADITLQFGIRKLGCYLGYGPHCSGSRELIELPFPSAYKKNISIRLLDENRDPLDLLTMSRQANRHSTLSVKSATDSGSHRERPSTAAPVPSSLHKYNNGVVHVIGGSSGLTGAPLYTARAAWSLGMGAVTLIHPAAWATSMAAQASEIIKKPVGTSESTCFTSQHVKEVLPFLQEKPGVIVIGPGAGRNEETAGFVRQIIMKSEGPVVIDADALHCIADHEEIITRRRHPDQVILTPHPGELSHLTQKEPDSDSDRLKISTELADRLGCTVLSKGNPVFVHKTGESGTILTGYDTTLFARAGFGDILAGHIAAFFSRTGNPHVSCEAGLLYGFRKLTENLSRGKRFPGPSDLL